MTDTTTPTPDCRRAAASRPIAGFGERINPYYWLRDDERKNPEVLAYLNAENAFREHSMAAAKPLENALYDEIVTPA